MGQYQSESRWPKNMEVPFAAILLIFILPSMTPAESDSRKKPGCDASTRGLYWPEEANHDSRALQEYARQGVLERCVSGPWRHRWQNMTVSAKAAAARADAQKTHKPPSAAPISTRNAEVPGAGGESVAREFQP